MEILYGGRKRGCDWFKYCDEHLDNIKEFCLKEGEHKCSFDYSSVGYC